MAEHDRDSNKTVYVIADGLTISDLLQEAGEIPLAVLAGQPSHKYLYRKMNIYECSEALEKNLLSLPKTQNQRTAEKWLSESLQHSRVFDNKSVKDQTQVVAEIALKKQGYSEIKEHSIPQRGAKNLQPKEGRPFNLTNTERLTNHKGGKVNIGLKGQENLDHFNNSIVKIEKINEHGFMNQKGYLRWIRRYKVGLAVTIPVTFALDAAAVTLSLIEDDGKLGPSTVVTLSEIAGGMAGGAIGAALLSFVPFVGAIIGGLLGSIIGNLIGKGINYLVFGLDILPGPGPPALEVNQPPTGAPDLEVNRGRTGPPSMGHQGATRGPPSTGRTTRIGAPGVMNIRNRDE